MTRKAIKLLERMRRSKSGWKRQNLVDLYEGFGFQIRHGLKHDIVKHPKFLNLRTTLPRHNYLAKGYVEYAVKLVDELIKLEKGEGEHGSAKES